MNINKKKKNSSWRNWRKKSNANFEFQNQISSKLKEKRNYQEKKLWIHKKRGILTREILFSDRGLFNHWSVKRIFRICWKSYEERNDTSKNSKVIRRGNVWSSQLRESTWFTSEGSSNWADSPCPWYLRTWKSTVVDCIRQGWSRSRRSFHRNCVHIGYRFPLSAGRVYPRIGIVVQLLIWFLPAERD